MHAGCSHRSRTAGDNNAYDVRGVNERGVWGAWDGTKFDSRHADLHE